MKICSFLWVYYGYPASGYEGINVEVTCRNRCGAALAQRDEHRGRHRGRRPRLGHGACHRLCPARRLPYRRPFVKYTPTWPRSFMPQQQDIARLVARMKLIPIRELIDGHRILFCDDSIVRGTQLKDTLSGFLNTAPAKFTCAPPARRWCSAASILNFSRSAL